MSDFFSLMRMTWLGSFEMGNAQAQRDVLVRSTHEGEGFQNRTFYERRSDFGIGPFPLCATSGLSQVNFEKGHL